jgi:hypothetical protein
MEQLAMYSQIIIALGIVMIVWQLEKAGAMLKLINKFLVEAVEDNE